MAAGHEDTFHHVRDWPYFEIPRVFGFGRELYDQHGHHLGYGIPLPNIAGFQITKFMALQALAALLMILVFWGLSRKVRDGQPVRGRFWGFWEMLALFIRDEVVRPAVGSGHHDHGEHMAPGHGHDDGGVYDPGTDHGPYESIETMGRGSHAAPHGHVAAAHGGAAVASVAHPADKYVPFIWTIFFYILFCNLLGAIPILGAATGHISVTAALAIIAFTYVVTSGMREQGPANFWKNIAPSMDIPGFIGPIVKVLIWVIEFAGLLIKHAVLAVRLFANIMAGHTVIAVILGFIAADAVLASTALWSVVTPASLVGQIAIGLLELFVAFLQAYVFALLTSLFIGMAVHAH